MSARGEVAAAAGNNAAWCDLFSALHGVRGAFAVDAWTSPARTPDGYPDAVTLRRSVVADRLLARIDASAGASVKDSFADLDLAPWGFEPLFHATWIGWTGRTGPTTGGGSPSWEAIRDPAALRAWEAAWGVPDGDRRRFPPGLLGATGVAVLAAVESGAVRGGAILNEAAGVVGLSNLFVASTDPYDEPGMATAFASAAEAARRLFPGRDLVGYERGADLNAALTAAFVPLGPLTVWIRP